MYTIFENLCSNSNIKPAQLAKEIGISQSIFSYWKSGKRHPSIKTMELIANYFNVSVDYLRGNTEHPQINPQNNTPIAIKDAIIVSNRNFMELVYKIYSLTDKDKQLITDYINLPNTDKKTIDDLINLLSSKNQVKIEDDS